MTKLSLSTEPLTRAFPLDFQFGAAAAAYQIEGAALNDGRTASIWDTFSALPGATANGETGLMACDHYNRYREDIRLMSELGLQTYRFSTSWARICPDGGSPNQKGLDFYKRLVDELGGAGIRPWLTLYHWDLPQALEDRGGWTNRDTVERFTDYADTVHDALGDRVSDWTTFNEPWCSAFLGYVGGQHAPGRRDPQAGVAAGHHILLAHGSTTRLLKERDESLQLGITLNLGMVTPKNPSDLQDIEAARLIDGQYNRFFLDPLFKGEYPEDVRADLAHLGLNEVVHDGDLDIISTPIDFLGVNYYHGDTVGMSPPSEPFGKRAATTRPTGSPYPAANGVHAHPTGKPVTGMGWEIEPEGLTTVLSHVYENYLVGTPVRLFVTENGAAFDDQVEDDGHIEDADRQSFLEAHLNAVLDAVDRGVPVDGYFYWSLLDNYEWAWGYEKRFGIIHVDYETQRRTIKASGRRYADIIRWRRI